MRHDPLRFATFVLGTFALSYYIGLLLQALRVWRRIGRCPVPALTEGGARNQAHLAAALLWPLPALLWAYDPGRFSRLPALAFLENWPCRLLGLLCLCSACAAAASALAELGEAWRLGVERAPVPLPSPGFVRSGIYGSIRHPIYSAVWLGSLGFFLMAPHLLFALLWAGSGAALLAQALHEEKALARRLGRPYQDYLARTGRFFPIIWGRSMPAPRDTPGA